MAPFEWLSVGYFAAWAALGALAALRRRKGSFQPARAAACALAAAELVIVARFGTPWAVRAWAPHVYLMLGYWIPALVAPPPTDDRFERWLHRADRRLRRRYWRELPTPDSLLPTQIPGPDLEVGSWRLGILSGLLELAYLLCYPLVPASFAVVFWLGDDAHVTRFWIAVLLAGYACYGTLPWTPARPPRSLPPEGGSYILPVASGFSRKSGLSSINLWVLGLVSHQRNTFPSGHVSVAVAAALSVMRVSIEAGLVVLLVAAGVAVAAVAGRYHYLVDVVLGLAVGVAAAAVPI